MNGPRRPGPYDFSNNERQQAMKNFIRMAGYSFLLAVLSFFLWKAPSFSADMDPMKMIAVHRAINANTVLAYDNFEGRLQMLAHGDGGSRLEFLVTFHGFYVVPRLVLTTAIKEGLNFKSIPGEWKDIYELVPKSVTFTGRVHSTAITECKTETSYRNVKRSTSASYSHTFDAPSPPAEGATAIEIQKWLNSATGFTDPIECAARIVVTSRQPEGGRAFADVYLKMKDFVGTSTTDEIDITYPPVVPEVKKKEFHKKHDAKCRFSFHAYQNSPKIDEIHRFQGIFPLQVAWINTEELHIPNPFSLESFYINASGASPTAWKMHPLKTDSCQILSDKSFFLTYVFSISAHMDIDAVLKPSEDNSLKEEKWKPEPYTTRKYVLKINEPSYKDVSAIRFRLKNVSEHPGVTTNAGNHLKRKDSCEDCGKRKVEYYTHKTQFHADADRTQKTLRRRYAHYNECKIDVLPDMFFTEKDNPGYTLGEKANTKDLLYPFGQEITLEKGIQEENTVLIYIADGAASADLTAEIQVGGAWYSAKAEGCTLSTADDTVLHIPLDKNDNGIQDDWEKQYKLSDSDDDNDNQPDTAHPGDGLTNFEEYRGVYLMYDLGYNRLDPTIKDLFTLDYSGDFLWGLMGAKRIYENAGVNFHLLKDNEFYQDVINYNDPDHKRGDQYIVVAMTDDLMVGDFSWLDGFLEGKGLASHIGPPTENANTVVVSGSFTYTDPGGLLAHEIGHNVNMRHHGETEKSISVNGEKGWVACVHGQHSGNFDCIMKYAAARWFLEAESVPDSLTLLQQSLLLKDYPANKGAKDKICTSPAGTGINAGGWSQDATSGSGNCLEQMRIRSWD